MSVVCAQTKVGAELTSDEALSDTAVDNDNKFLSVSNVYRSGRPGELGCSVESLSLDESWPDSERSSTTELVSVLFEF